jgi:hypothetical protein
MQELRGVVEGEDRVEIVRVEVDHSVAVAAVPEPLRHLFEQRVGERLR